MKYIKHIFEANKLRHHSIGQINREFLNKIDGFDLDEIESFCQLVRDESDRIVYISLSACIDKNFKRTILTLDPKEYSLNTRGSLNISQNDLLIEFENGIFNKGFTINNVKNYLGSKFRPTMDYLVMNTNGFLYFEIVCIPSNQNSLIELRGTIDDKNNYSDMFYTRHISPIYNSDGLVIRIFRKEDRDKFTVRVS